MTRLKLTITLVGEYEANPQDYVGCTTAEEMAALDQKQIESDPALWLETWLESSEAESAKAAVLVEVVEE